MWSSRARHDLATEHAYIRHVFGTRLKIFKAKNKEDFRNS